VLIFEGLGTPILFPWSSILFGVGSPNPVAKSLRIASIVDLLRVLSGDVPLSSSSYMYMMPKFDADFNWQDSECVQEKVAEADRLLPERDCRQTLRLQLRQPLAQGIACQPGD
jgi:hypothetical protein